MVRSPLRRHLITGSLILTITTLVLIIGTQAFAEPARGSDPAESEGALVPDAVSPAYASLSAWQPIELELVEAPEQPLITLAPPAADDCTPQPPPSLTLSIGSLDSGQTDVTSATTNPADPLLSCMWGSPVSNRGFRTVWYKFDALSYGRVIISTQGSNYDTVVAVYPGGCGGPVVTACNDDHLGFTSRVSFDVVQGLTYYVEVADWQEHPPAGGGTLSLSAAMVPINSKWQPAGVMPLARSRHATVVVGNDIYVIGGQSGSLTPPTIVQQMDRFETDSGSWVSRAAMPGGYGYANTTAAYVDGPSDGGRIYLPAGDTGNVTTFGGEHLAYDIAGNFWITATSAPWPGGIPIAWSAAVANPAETGYYLTGGLSSQPPFDPNAQVHDEVFFYTPVTNGWSSIQPMGSARYAHTAALVGGQVCVAGGVSTGNVLLTDGECFTPGGSSWTPTGTMNEPRYAAGSGVSPEGKWYVFGGIDAFGNAVPMVEVYDPATNNWTALDVRFDLGGGRTGVIWPDRAWPRGGFVGSTLWAIGGNDNNQQAQPMVDKLLVTTGDSWMPVIAKEHDVDDVPDDTFGTARQLLLNQPQQQDFDNQADIDFFTFTLSAPTLVTVRLTNIPAGKNFNLAVYSANKFLWGTGENLGNQDESVSLMLAAGRYYVAVERFTGLAQPGQFYQITVED